MFVTLFGDVQWGDTRGLWQFLLAHDLKHQALAQAVGRQGVQLPVFLLADQIDDKWLQDHSLQHTELAQLLVPSSTSSVVDLTENPLSDEDSFYYWMDLHNQLHQQLDQAFGITN